MCGITGFIDFSKRTDDDILRKMLDTLQRRGPDDQGCFFSNNLFAHVGLGHRRLSILDLSVAGHQPYHFEGLHLVTNGEVYNFQEIRKTLQQKDYQFQSNSDTEVIIKAFHCWGIQAVQQFRGMFAFCLYDTNQQKAYLFRDRVGVKPLYYYRKNHLILFGSALAPLMQHPEFEKRLDKQGLSEYIQFGYIAYPYSIFENTFKLQPGHYVEIDFKTQQFLEKSYWDICDHIPKVSNNISEEDATEELDQLLQESFQLRMVSDVPVGCLLSGGIDSSLVTAILQSNHSKPLHTFTIGFLEKEYNEANHAKQIADYLGTNHREYYCTKQDVLDLIPSLAEIYDEPFADESAIPTYLVARLAKQYVKVVLSGDGGDEVFGGYDSYAITAPLLQKLKYIPGKNWMSKLGNLIADPIFLLDFAVPKYYKKYLQLKMILSSQNDAMLHRSMCSIFTPYEVKRLLSGFSSSDFVYPSLPSCEMVETMMLVDFKMYLPENILSKVDRATMHHSLEGREPLLDHKIIEYAANLPLPYKRQKKILKNVLARYLPRHLFERKKQGFGVPIHTWLHTDLKHFVDEYLDENKIRQEGLFNISHIRHIKKMFFSRKMIDHRKIWTILMFQMWKDRYL